MASFQMTVNGVTLRFGDVDTPIPEGSVAADPRPKIVVALSPADATAKVTLVLHTQPLQRVPLKATRQVRQEQFFEANFPDLSAEDGVEYSVKAQLLRDGTTVKLDSGQAVGGI